MHLHELKRADHHAEETTAWQKKLLSIATWVEALAIKRWSIYRKKAFLSPKRMWPVILKPYRS